MALYMLIRLLADFRGISIEVAIRRIFPSTLQREEFWPRLERNPVQFWNLTGKTPASLTSIVNRIWFDVGHFIRNHRNPRHRLMSTRPFALSTRDRILMPLIWLLPIPLFQILVICLL